MTTPSREEIVGLMQDLPMDDTWLPMFMLRLKETYPDLYDEVMKSAKTRLEEKTT